MARKNSKQQFSDALFHSDRLDCAGWVPSSLIIANFNGIHAEVHLDRGTAVVGVEFGSPKADPSWSCDAAVTKMSR